MIRKALPSDIDQLSRLFDLYRQFYKQESDIEGAKNFLKDRFQNQESVIFVSYEQDRPSVLTGFTQLYPAFSSVGMKRTWILNDLYVHETFRKRGFAEELLDAAVSFSKGTGARNLMLQTAMTNEAAQKLYEKKGWKKDEKFFSYYFHHSI